MIKIADFGLGKDLNVFTSHQTMHTNAVGGLLYALEILPSLILITFFQHQSGIACYCGQAERGTDNFPKKSSTYHHP